jgi:hypothetical protein
MHLKCQGCGSKKCVFDSPSGARAKTSCSCKSSYMWCVDCWNRFCCRAQVKKLEVVGCPFCGNDITAWLFKNYPCDIDESDESEVESEEEDDVSEEESPEVSDVGSEDEDASENEDDVSVQDSEEEDLSEEEEEEQSEEEEEDLSEEEKDE